jgi:hypothetical protein
MSIVVSNTNITFPDANTQNTAGITSATDLANTGQSIVVDRSGDTLRFKRIAHGTFLTDFANSNVVILQGHNLFSPPGPPGPPGPIIAPPPVNPTK